MLGVLALAIAVLVALVPLAQGAIERSRAQTAADAAALAGAAQGEEAAREIAEANGASVVTWRAAGDDVWVEVSVGKALAGAKAHRD